MPENSHFLSVIIPIYRQEKTIVQDILSIYHTLEKIRYDFEIVAVVDGKNIDKSYELIKKIRLPKLKHYTYKYNHGKGYAIRFGMARTKGDYIAFIDAGMEIDPNGLSMLIEHLEWYQADIIVGSKLHPASIIKYPFFRQIFSFGAHLIARFLLNINVHDTQAGIKLFKRNVLIKVLPRLLVKSFAFDLEILAVAKHLGFSRIYEAPIKLNFVVNGTHLNNSFFKTAFYCLLDSLAIFYRLRLLRYYDDKNNRRWIYNKDLQMRINIG